MSYLSTIDKRLGCATLLSVADVAAALAISRSKVHQLIESGDLAAANLNADSTRRPFYRITREAVLTYARTTQGATTP